MSSSRLEVSSLCPWESARCPSHSAYILGIPPNVWNNHIAQICFGQVGCLSLLTLAVSELAISTNLIDHSAFHSPSQPMGPCSNFSLTPCSFFSPCGLIHLSNARHSAHGDPELWSFLLSASQSSLVPKDWTLGKMALGCCTLGLLSWIPLQFAWHTDGVSLKPSS